MSEEITWAEYWRVVRPHVVPVVLGAAFAATVLAAPWSLSEHFGAGHQRPAGIAYRPIFLPPERTTKGNYVTARLHSEVVVLEWIVLAACYAAWRCRKT